MYVRILSPLQCLPWYLHHNGPHWITWLSAWWTNSWSLRSNLNQLFVSITHKSQEVVSYPGFAAGLPLLCLTQSKRYFSSQTQSLCESAYSNPYTRGLGCRVTLEVQCYYSHTQRTTWQRVFEIHSSSGWTMCQTLCHALRKIEWRVRTITFHLG